MERSSESQRSEGPTVPFTFWSFLVINEASTIPLRHSQLPAQPFTSKPWEVNDPPNGGLDSWRKLLENWQKIQRAFWRCETRIWVSTCEMTGIERGSWGMRTGFLSGQALSPCLNPCCDPEASQQAVCVCVSYPTPLPSLLWRHGQGWGWSEAGAGITQILKDPWKLDWRSPPLFQPSIDFKYAEAEQALLSWNKGSNSLSF